MAKNKYPGVRGRDGRYTYRYSVAVVDPITKRKKRKQKETEAYPTAKAAYEAGILITSRKLQGQLVDEKNVDLENWVKRWIEDYELEREVKASTLRMRQYAVDVIVRYLGSNTLVRDVSKAAYQKMLNTMKKDGMSKNTIRIVHGGCSMLFSDAVRKEIIAETPTLGAIVPAFRKTTVDLDEDDLNELPEYLEKEELKKFLSIARFQLNAMMYAVFLVLAYTGLRIGELRALQWSDFDRDAGVLKIKKTLFTTSNLQKYVFQTPKTKWSRRDVSIGQTVTKALVALEKWQKSFKVECGENYHKDRDFIFISEDLPGFPICDILIRRYMRKILKMAELPKLTPHSLRHTHVSLLAENKNVRLEDIQARCGHRNGSTITLIYLHVTKKKQKEMPDHFEYVIQS